MTLPIPFGQVKLKPAAPSEVGNLARIVPSGTVGSNLRGRGQLVDPSSQITSGVGAPVGVRTVHAALDRAGTAKRIASRQR